ncbi:hypothetical protein ATCC90586_010507 [Pythium insidiosum]|nr:hypothetical protein ATCC90586_010507 [Pythium insidiosum]
MRDRIRLSSEGQSAGNRTCDFLAASQPFDYEQQRIHRFRLTVTDTGVGFLSDSVEVVLFVQDVNEPPELVATSVQRLQLEENAPAGLVLAQLQAVDPEGDAVTFRLSQVTPVSDAVVIWDNGTVVSSSTPCDYESMKALNEPALTVRALMVSGNTSVPFSFDIAVLDVDEAPVFLQPLFDLAVNELAKPGTMIGVVRATDVDAGDALAYSLLAEAYAEDRSELFSMDAGLQRWLRCASRF